MIGSELTAEGAVLNLTSSMSFDLSLKLVHESLLQIREQRGGDLRASAEALARLVHAKPPGGGPVRPTAVPEETTVVRFAPRRTAEQAPEDVIIEKQSKTSEIVSSEKMDAGAACLDERGGTPASTTKASRMTALKRQAMSCQKCPTLANTRTQVVFGEGNLDAELMFIGEAPGEEEDLQGAPFVDKAGQLLKKIIETMGFKPGEVYLANVLKCRPDVPAETSGNRKPKPEEMQACIPYLAEQIEIIRPKLLVALGATAMEGLTGTHEPIGHLRGHWHEYQGIPVMPTYHPAYLIHKPSLGEKRKVWEDMLLVIERLGKPITGKQRGFFLAKSGG